VVFIHGSNCINLGKDLVHMVQILDNFLSYIMEIEKMELHEER